MRAMAQVQAAKIGTNLICKVQVSKRQEKCEFERKLANAVLILDCSGSMGSWVQRSVNAWQQALKAVHFDEEDEVHIIQFESQVKMTQHKVKDLARLNLQNRGGTYMAGVVFELEKLLNNYRGEPLSIWVVSDGQISDQKLFTSSMMRTLARHLNSPGITVLGVRLCLGSNDPDVQAMSAVGLLSTRKFQLHDLEVTAELDHDLKRLTSALMAMGSQREERVSVGMYYAQLVRRPGEEAKKSLVLENKDWFMVKNANGKTEIKINQTPTNIELLPESENLSVLEQFASRNYSRLMQEKIAGLYDNSSYIAALEELFADLDKMTTAVNITMTSTSTDLSTSRRALEIKKKLAKQEKTIRLRISELRNLDNIDSLSGHVKSDLLRNLGSGRGDMRLIKRFARTDNGKDPTQMMQDSVQKCKRALSQLASEKDISTEICFFSRERSFESALIAIESFVDFGDSSEVTPDSLLTVFGLHGIAIQHKVDNYTDPMRIGLNQGLGDTIHKVYTNVCLNQSVLWYAKENGHEIQAPGFNDVITGVVPIKAWNHPAVWKLFCIDTQIGAMQTSAHMRNVLTPLPKDRQAFTTSLLLKMMSIWEKPTEIEAKIMADVLDSIQSIRQSELSKKIAAGLQGPEPLASMSTENGLASDLAPFAHVLSDPVLLGYLAEPTSWRLWRALVANTVYWTVRGEIANKDPEELLKKILGYSPANSQQVLPDDQEEPDDVVFHDDWDEETAKQNMVKMNSKLTKLYQNVFALAKRFKDAGMIISPSLFHSSLPKSSEFLSQMVGMDLDLFCFVETVKTFEAKSETERYQAGSTGFHSDENKARDYLRNVVAGIYRREYQDQLKQKQNRIKAAKLQNFLLNFRAMSFKEFVGRLQENVPNRASMGINELLEILADDVESVVDPVGKVELLLTGKYEKSTWNNGSVAR